MVCLGPYRSAVHLLLALVVLVGWPWPVCSRVVFFLGLQGSSLLLLLFLGFGVLLPPLLSVLAAWVLAV